VTVAYTAHDPTRVEPAITCYFCAEEIEILVSREKSGIIFLFACEHFDDTTRRWVATKHGIDPTTGQELVAKKELAETLPAIKRWIRRGRPKTEIYRTTVVQRPLINPPGLASAILKFLDNPDTPLSGHRS
jgi:hypothetical protein